MIIKLLNKTNKNEVANLFTSVFTSSEGDKEGKIIGNLALELSYGIDNQDIVSFGVYEEELIIGSIFFTRLIFKADILVYMLAPVAVSTKHQRQGVGKALIDYGLYELKNRFVAVVVTYGDPSYYSKTGFHPLSESIIQAPLKLSMPEGWLGQSLNQESIPAVNERPRCVKEFNDPTYW